MSWQKASTGDVALAVHDPARAQRVTHALVHPVLERDLDVQLERLQPADAGGVYHVVGPSRAAAVGGGDHGGVEPVGLDVTLDQVGNQPEVVFVYVHEGDGAVRQLRHGKDVGSACGRR